MTLFIADNLDSQRVRMALAEKSITADVIQVNPNEPSQLLLEINPDGVLPLLVDRELLLDKASVISEYLDERFPHPPLLPVYPVSRARSRMMITQIVDEWYPDAIAAAEKSDIEKLEAVAKSIYALVPLLEDTTFFLSNEFSLVDCALAPLLWLLKMHNIEVDTHSPMLKRYCHNVFSRDSFKISISEQDIVTGIVDEVE